mmetsp:Transcript_33817/g.32922  ORF Transcript_33817/g.32922 Transcript_33817/m.32922 type:complete len:216 (+) Transcript_33817:973-1620(+)
MGEEVQVLNVVDLGDLLEQPIPVDSIDLGVIDPGLINEDDMGEVVVEIVGVIFKALTHRLFRQLQVAVFYLNNMVNVNDGEDLAVTEVEIVLVDQEVLVEEAFHLCVLAILEEPMRSHQVTDHLMVDVQMLIEPRVLIVHPQQTKLLGVGEVLILDQVRRDEEVVVVGILDGEVLPCLEVVEERAFIAHGQRPDLLDHPCLDFSDLYFIGGAVRA